MQIKKLFSTATREIQGYCCIGLITRTTGKQPSFTSPLPFTQVKSQGVGFSDLGAVCFEIPEEKAPWLVGDTIMFS